MNNKTIIEFGFRIIWRIMDDGIMAQEIIPSCYPSDIDKLQRFWLVTLRLIPIFVPCLIC